MCTFVKDCVKYSSFKSSKIFSSVQVFWVSLCANSFSLPWAWGWTITFLRVLKIGLILKVSSLRNHSWTYMWKKIRSPEPSALYGSSRKTPLAIWPPKGRNSWGPPPKSGRFWSGHLGIQDIQSKMPPTKLPSQGGGGISYYDPLPLWRHPGKAHGSPWLGPPQTGGSSKTYLGCNPHWKVSSELASNAFFAALFANPYWRSWP